MLLLVVGLLLAAAPAAGGKKGRKKGADCPQMKLKRQWGGKPAHGINYQVRPVRFVVIHHTVTSACSGFVQCAELLQGMQSYHQTQLDYHDIGYK